MFKTRIVLYEYTYGQLKVMASVLENLAAGWIGSIAILPSVFGIETITEFVALLTYSIFFATLAMYLASKIEDSLYGK